MNKALILGGSITGLVLAGGVAGMVSAQSVAAETGLTEEQIIEIALTEVPGEIEEIEFEKEWGDAAVYEVEVLALGGSEIELEIDAQTGEVLEVEFEDDHDCDDDDDDDEA